MNPVDEIKKLIQQVPPNYEEQVRQNLSRMVPSLFPVTQLPGKLYNPETKTIFPNFMPNTRQNFEQAIRSGNPMDYSNLGNEGINFAAMTAPVTAVNGIRPPIPSNIPDDLETASEIYRKGEGSIDDVTRARQTIMDEAKRQMTPEELAKVRNDTKKIMDITNRRLGVEEKGVSVPQGSLPKDTMTVYRGGRDLGDKRILTPAKQNSGALFFTPSEKYAKQYSATPDQGSGVYKTTIKTDKIFDITNPAHVKQLEKYIQPEVLKSMKDATSHGAVDWATASQFIDEIQAAGFKGAKFLERPAENIIPQLDGSFKLEGKPVYSYALFDKSVPIEKAYPQVSQLPVSDIESKIRSGKLR